MRIDIQNCLDTFKMFPDPSRGKGGFTISYSNHKSINEGYVKIEGDYVNPFGPFKKKLYIGCTIQTLHYTYQLYLKDEFREALDSHKVPVILRAMLEKMNEYLRVYPDCGSSYIKEVSEGNYYYCVKEVPSGTYE